MIGYLLLAIGYSGSAGAAESKIIASGAKLEKLADGFIFTEGPACDAHGNVFFTDQPNDRIMEWSTDGKLSTFMQPCGRSNGLCFDSQGNLWACADEKNELWRIPASEFNRAANRAATVRERQSGSSAAEPAQIKHDLILKDYQGKLLNGPNDIWILPKVLRASFSPDGKRIEEDHALYFTDPYYKRPYWHRGPKEMDECVYYLTADGKTYKRVIDDMKQPNGIIGTPDGKTLYVSDIGAGKTYSYKIQRDGSLTNKTLFCELGSDGMTIDNKGNVYLTGHGVTVFDSSGQQIEHMDVPESWTGNICFCGKDRQTLFITASKGIYAMKMKVMGVGSQ
ncbi:MAG: gluconolactonase [Verrucomicrobia bacterium]|nr:MAG: gluconolactonase [Verrucomicrobiota bacterium]